MHSPSPPQPTAAQLQQEKSQGEASALLDQQENMRRKRLLNAAAGLRAFTGAAITRQAPGNRAGTDAMIAAAQSTGPAAAPVAAPPAPGGTGLNYLGLPTKG